MTKKMTFCIHTMYMYTYIIILYVHNYDVATLVLYI